MEEEREEEGGREGEEEEAGSPETRLGMQAVYVGGDTRKPQEESGSMRGMGGEPVQGAFVIRWLWYLIRGLSPTGASAGMNCKVAWLEGRGLGNVHSCSCWPLAGGCWRGRHELLRPPCLP